MKRHFLKHKCLFAAILIAPLLISMLPLPSRVVLKADGKSVTASGTLLADVSLAVDGWRLDFLFFRDLLYAKVAIKTVPSLTTADIYGRTEGAVFSNLSENICYVGLSCYDETQNRSVMGYFFFDTSIKDFFLTGLRDNCNFVASADPCSDLNEVYARFFQNMS